jgi:hypothetical protein
MANSTAREGSSRAGAAGPHVRVHERARRVVGQLVEEPVARQQQEAPALFFGKFDSESIFKCAKKSL